MTSYDKLFICSDCGQEFALWQDDNGDLVDEICPDCDRERIEEIQREEEGEMKVKDRGMSKKGKDEGRGPALIPANEEKKQALDLTTDPEIGGQFEEYMILRGKVAEMEAAVKVQKEKSNLVLVNMLLGKGLKSAFCPNVGTATVVDGKSVSLNRDAVAAGMLKAGLKAAVVEGILAAATKITPYTTIQLTRIKNG